MKERQTLIREDLRRLIADLSQAKTQINDDEDILKGRVIRSIQLLELINYIADHYQIEITGRDIFLGHFSSINAMVQFISKQSVPFVKVDLENSILQSPLI